ncbi:MAG: hypothetical protein Q4D05_03180 [Acinetobacter sp.]|nr:hypothetical protein [Acinetobacter sp.]
MKKFLLTALALAATSSAFANTTPAVQLAPNNIEPKLMLSIYLDTGKSLQPTTKQSISLSNPNERLCWHAFDLTLPHQVDVEEFFISPARTSFSHSKSRSQTSADGLQHIVQSSLKSINNSAVSQCWKFDKTDPVGTYQFAVKVADVEYPVQTFEVTK